MSVTSLFLDEVLPAPVDDILKSYATRMLRAPSEVRVETDLRGVPNVHFDPVLKKNPRRYQSVVKRCHRIGMLGVTLKCESELGILFVKKKNDRLRLILDCRATNILFKDPPRTDLVIGEGLSDIEVELDNEGDGE